MDQPRLKAAERLLAAGARESALRVLEGAQGYHSVARLKRWYRSLTQGLPPGIYALTVHQGQGLVLPFEVAPGVGLPGVLDEQAALAQQVGLQVARDHLGLAQMRYHLAFADCFEVEGASLGLAAGLAFLARLSGRFPEVPVLATGSLDSSGRVGPVGHVREKLEAAWAELSSGPGLVLACPSDVALADPSGRALGVARILDVLPKIFGAAPLTPAPGQLELDEVLAKAQRRGASSEEMLRALSVFEPAALPPDDQVRLWAAKGTHARHLGRSEEAARYHQAARQTLAQVGCLGRSAVETMETEFWATRIDLYEPEKVEEELRLRLTQPFDLAHNRIRVRGMLAQVLATRGRAAEALPLRRENLSEQGKVSEMRAEIPRTLTCLALEAALARDGQAFEEAAQKLASSRLDQAQDRYTVNALVRGLVLMGRSQEALDWALGRTTPWGLQGSDSLSKLLRDGPSGFPSISTARALLRAYRRIGEVEAARALAGRLPGEQAAGGLIRWLALLAESEGLLVEGPSGIARLADLAKELRVVHPQASRFHAGLLAAMQKACPEPGQIEVLEGALDRVYY